ncbi:MAG TPA: zf-HC2 domain-containing protein [Thermoanaerobaculia bacterium]|nr:zf-HC2 domain-containing protein [Thermoanaerobaculia bacterium]
MTAQAAHLDRELLSAYLDRELGARDHTEVEEHLARCPGCRADLDGLARAVGALARLERAAPPAALGELVARRVALDTGRRGWLDGLERRLSTLAPQPPVLVLFTVTVALAFIVYSFVHAMDRQGRGEVSIRPASAEAARPLLERVETRRVGGREVVLRDGAWRELSTLGEAPARTVAAGTPEAAELLARHPWLAELAAEGRAVVLRDGEEVVALQPAPPTAPSAKAAADDDR